MNPTPATETMAVKSSLTDNEIAFFCISDDAFFLPSIIALRSIRRFHPEAGYFMLGSFSDNDRALEMLTKCGISYIHVADDGIYKDAVDFSTGRIKWPSLCFWHFSIYPLLLKRDFKWACYVDGDVLCVNPIDSRDVFSRDAALAAVPKKDKRINSGVLFYNNTYLQKIGLAETAKDYYLHHKICSHHECTGYCRQHGDQELLDILLKDMKIPWKRLHPRFNYLLLYPYRLCGERNASMIFSAEECTFIHLLLKPWIKYKKKLDLYPMLQQGFTLWNEMATEVVGLLK